METMEARSCCIFCYKKYREEPDYDYDELNNRHHHDKLLSGEERKLLQRFFDLFERYMGMEGEGEQQTKSFKTATCSAFMEKLISCGLVGACEECFQIVESFCTLFDDMKSIELLLKWKVSELQNIMDQSRRFPSRVEAFKQIFNQGDAEIGWKNRFEDRGGGVGNSSADAFNLTVDFKRRLMSNCIQKVVFSYPKLSLRKCTSPTSHIPTKSYTDSLPPTRATHSFHHPQTTTTSSTSVSVGELPLMELSHCLLKDKDFDGKLETTVEPVAAMKVETVDNQNQTNRDSNSSITMNNAAASKEVINVNESLLTSGLKEEEIEGRANLILEELLSLPLPPPPPDYKFECKDCGLLFSNAYQMGGHRSKAHRLPPQMHDDEFRYPCKSCERRFRSFSALQKHRQALHEGIRYKCLYESCFALSYTQLTSIKYHLRTVHADTHSQSSSNEELQQFYRKIRINKMPPVNFKKKLKNVQNFRSEEEKSINSNELLQQQQQQINIIDNLDQFKCKDCGKLFFTKLEMEGHRLLKECRVQVQLSESAAPTATAAPPPQNRNRKILFPCYLCPKKFRYSWSLTTHIESSHEGVKYQCNHCPRDFIQASTAMKHFRTQHQHAHSSSSSGETLRLRLQPYTKSIPSKKLGATECNEVLKNFGKLTEEMVPVSFCNPGADEVEVRIDDSRTEQYAGEEEPIYDEAEYKIDSIGEVKVFSGPAISLNFSPSTTTTTKQHGGKWS